MKSFKRIFMIGVLALASMGMFVGQREAKADTKPVQTTVYRCRSDMNNPRIVNNKDTGEMTYTTDIFKLGSTKPSGFAKWDYSHFSDPDSSSPIGVKGTVSVTHVIDGKTVEYTASAAHGVVSFGQSTIQDLFVSYGSAVSAYMSAVSGGDPVTILQPQIPVIQQLWSDYYKDELAGKTKCRCISLHKDLGEDNFVLTVYNDPVHPENNVYVEFPPYIIDGFAEVTDVNDSTVIGDLQNLL